MRDDNSQQKFEQDQQQQYEDTMTDAAAKPKLNDQLAALARLREPFPDNQISKLPKESKKQADERKANLALAINCQVCGSWHHKNAVHLDYVGHAALTDRLLDVDPLWSWEPVAFDDTGLPAFDKSGGLWIRLTVRGMTRLGYGHAAAKSFQDPGAREKEVIGDALRNAAMRFGAALDLWHKGVLHGEIEEEADKPKLDPEAKTKHTIAITGTHTIDDLKKAYSAAYKEATKAGDADALGEFARLKDARKKQIDDAGKVAT